MNLRFKFAVLALWIAICGIPAVSSLAAEAPRMDKEELKAKLGAPGIVLIDVRALTDWLLTSDKIKGAVREKPGDFEEWAGKYPKDKTIVLYCA